MSLTSPAKNTASTKAGVKDERSIRVFLDTETTGIHDEAEMIQLSYILDGKERGVYDEYYAPKGELDYEAMSINRITPEMLEGKRTIDEPSMALDKLSAINTQENFLIIHNAGFDLNMLKKAGFENKMRLIDTLQCARHLLEDAQRHTLMTIFFQYGLYKRMNAIEKEMNRDFGVSLKRVGAHNALYDIVVLKEVYSLLLERAGSPETLVELTQKPVFIKKPLTFGKHAGKTIEEIGEIDTGYLEWMRENMNRLDDNMKYTINAILKRKREGR